jgi:hypothetical protein
MLLPIYRSADRVEASGREILIRIYRARFRIRLEEKNGPVGGLNQMKPSEKRVDFRLAVPAQYKPVPRFIVIVYYIRCVQTKDRHVQYIASTGMCTYVHILQFCPHRNQIRSETGSDLFVTRNISDLTYRLGL